MAERLAIEAGAPVCSELLSYGRQNIEEPDVWAVAEVLRSDWLTTGPKVREFEKAFGRFVGVGQAVALSSGTAALHAAMHALGVGPGDEVIVPTLTFVASANCVLYQGATPVFADVDAQTLLLDTNDVKRKITPKTKAIIAVDYAGHPCDYDGLRNLAASHGAILIADACHSLGASYKGRAVGTLADLNVFSFHPVKAMTTGEGGVVTTESAELGDRLRRFRNHGISGDHFEREQNGSWFYEMIDLGYNYRITDIQCALGLSQLRRLPEWVVRRQAIAYRYDQAFADLPAVQLQAVRPEVCHAYHLYVIRLDSTNLSADRARVFTALRAEGIGVNVHYLPVHLHPYYRRRFGTGPGLCPKAEAAYEEILSLPIFPSMRDEDVENVIEALWKVISAYAIEPRRAAIGHTR